MIIKKFVAKTEEEAIAAAKKELGENVVVMNVKVIKHKGLKGLFGARQTEVTVALEADNTPVRATLRESVTDSLETQVKATQNAVHVMSESSQNIEKKLDSLQNLLVSQLKQGESETAEKTPETDVETEAVAEKKESKTKKKSVEQEKFVRLLYNTMLENEMDEKYINLIMDDIELDGESQRDVPFDYILANVYQKMILKFGKAEGITAAEKNPKVVVFMGPTGVGKTTTIAKIASKYSMEEKKKVALITADTYRIAAAEQLRIYANILEVPFRVIYTEEEALAAIEDFRDCDYIFVDTAGHSHKNESQKANMNSFIHAVDENVEKEAYLVLSATTKYRDLLSIADSYSEMTDYKLIFTKLDETITLGNLLNLKLYTGAPLSYVTCGQNVPDDIEQFNPQKTVKLLLGGKSK